MLKTITSTIATMAAAVSTFQSVQYSPTSVAMPTGSAYRQTHVASDSVNPQRIQASMKEKTAVASPHNLTRKPDKERTSTPPS
jgi:P pilus assembly chaperone PapD